jgi:hypothetical protein
MWTPAGWAPVPAHHGIPPAVTRLLKEVPVFRDIIRLAGIPIIVIGLLHLVGAFN